MATIAAVAAGGSLGTLARYGLDVAIEGRSFSLFPWSTFTINLSGCFLVGLLIAALVDRHHAPHWLRIGLVEEKAVGLALLNATASVASASWPSSSARASGACCSARSTISRWLQRIR